MKDLIRICIHAFIIILFVSSIIGVSGTQYYNGPSSSQPDALSLTPGENEWITSHPVIKICPDPYYPPFELLTEEGGYVGISSEILKKISERAGLSLEVVPCENWSLCIEKIRNRDIDILGAIYVSDLRSDYLAYSDPFYTSPLVIITKNTAPQDLTMEDLSGKTVAVVDGYTSHLLLLNQYPSIHPVVVSNVPSGLEKVVFGSADAYLGDLATAAYHVEKSGFSNLQTSGTVYLPELKLHDLAFGIRNDQPELISIINKGLDSISDTEMNEVYSRWIPASLTQPFISRQIFIGILVVIAIFLLILSGFFLWNRILKRAVTEKTRQLVDELEQRKIIQEELRIKNDELYTAYEQ
ncbi:MAG: transporter substrate-binding domain-containing protein, partial [Methanomicrobiales archaeon]|nr:transporter substrate-binding domain-containing protein [Methanomicrobiales archaeon]